MKTTIGLAAIALSLACIPAFAQDNPKAGTVGVGSTSCATYIKEYREDLSKAYIDNRERRYFVWAQGFMSGYNTAILDKKLNEPMINLLGNPPDAQVIAIREYCERHPSDDYLSA